MAFSSGQVVEGWELIRRLGEGGQGEVWLAFRGQELALKLLTNVAADANALNRFAREVETLKSLGNWPGIVPLVDADVNGTPPWLSMPLATPIDRSTAMAMQAAVSGMAEVADTLHELYEQRRISHRDLYPGNLFVLDERWCVGDFGLVRNPAEKELTGEGEFWPRVGFIAPEMMDHPSTADGPAADVFSVAKCLWCLVVGDRPPTGQLDASDEGLRDLPLHLQRDQRWRYVLILLEAATHQDRFERPSLDRLRDELVLWQRGDLGSGGFGRSQKLVFDKDFWQSARAGGIGDFERRQIVRTVWLLDLDEQPPSLVTEEQGGVTWIRCSRHVTLAYLDSGEERQLLMCKKDETDPSLFGDADQYEA